MVRWDPWCPQRSAVPRGPFGVTGVTARRWWPPGAVWTELRLEHVELWAGVRSGPLPAERLPCPVRHAPLARTLLFGQDFIAGTNSVCFWLLPCSNCGFKFYL